MHVSHIGGKNPATWTTVCWYTFTLSGMGSMAKSRTQALGYDVWKSQTVP